MQSVPYFFVVMLILPFEVLSECRLTANEILCSNTNIVDAITNINNIAAVNSLNYIYHLSFSATSFEEDQIQKDWLNSINITFTSLNIQYSTLSNIEPESFSGSPFDNLIHLSIINTEISSITSDVFKNTKLTSLTLISGDIFSPLNIEENALGSLSTLVTLSVRGYLQSESLLNLTGPNTELSSLIRLDIGYNNIEVLQNDSFVGVPNLEVLYVDNSNVERVEEGAFHGQVLKLLDLSKNKLSTLPENLFENVLTGISIYDNKWECNCDLVWLRDLFVQKPSLFTHRMFYCSTSEGDVPFTDVEFCPS